MTMRNTMRIGASVLACLWALGCGGEKQEPASEPGAPAEPAAQAPAAEAKAPEAKAAPEAPAAGELPPPSPDNPSKVDDAKFTLSLAPAGEYKAGQLGRVVVQLDAKGEYHVNQEYPISIDVKGTNTQISMPKSQFERPDATAFAEKSARFEIPLTVSTAGKHPIMAQVKFAVCTEENCWEDARNLALELAVN